MADELEKSFQILKQTVPLMVKHQVPAVPTNYALWYTYASQKSPELNQQVDEALKISAQLSESKTTELYRQHLADTQELNTWQLRQSLEAMLQELNQTMQDTRKESDQFRQNMDGCLDDLAKVEKEGWTLEEVMGLVRTMVQETQGIRKSTLSFNAALANAEKEIAQLREQLAESQHDALYDALTGLRNRRYFDEELKAMLAKGDVALLLVDIDHFKNINDTYGHVMGDLVIKAVAKKLRSLCRDGADAFRYGGEEFAVLLPATPFASARHRAEGMRSAIEKINVVNRLTNESLGDVTASFGIACSANGDSPQTLIERADKQLYDAKRLGRNRVMPLAI